MPALLRRVRDTNVASAGLSRERPRGVAAAAEAATACMIVTGAFLEELETVATVAAIAKTLKKPSAIVLNRVSRSHALTLARTALGTFRLPVCPTAMAQLVTHAYASAEGETANEREPSGKAAEEVAAVYKWLQKEGLV